jgi:hypothetical protein
MSIGDLLKAILGGGAANQRSQQTQAGQDPLAEILGSILGGGTAQQKRSATQQDGFGLDDIVGAILGGSGSGSTSGANSFLTPIIQALAQKLGLPPQMAGAVVAFVLTKVLPGLMGGGRLPSATPTPSGRGAVPQQQEGLDLDGLLEQMGGAHGVDQGYWRSTGIADQLAQQTGLDANTAAMSLQEVFQMIAGQLGAARQQSTPAQPKRGGLDHLLDTWET